MPAKDAKNKRRKLPRNWRVKFLKALAQCGVMSYAAKSVPVNVVTVDRHRKKDPLFDAAIDRAIEESIDTLEMVARQRAVKGTAKPVFQQGRQVGSVQEYSDTLLMFLMKANRPEKYRDSYDIKRLVDELIRQNASESATDTPKGRRARRET